MKLILANTEVNYFGKQLMTFYLERHAIGASTHKGTEEKLNYIRNYPAPTRVLVNGDGGIVAIGILSPERAKEIVRTATLEKSWDPSSIPDGATIPLRIVYRTLEHFHRFTRPVKMKDLQWTKEYMVPNRTISEMPDGPNADMIWAAAVKRALDELAVAWG